MYCEHTVTGPLYFQTCILVTKTFCCSLASSNLKQNRYANEVALGIFEPPRQIYHHIALQDNGIGVRILHILKHFSAQL